MGQYLFMILKILHIYIIVFFLIIGPVYCFSMELTLHEAVKLALENNSEVRLNNLELEIRKSEIKREQAQFIPILNLDSSYTYREDDPDTSDLTTNNQNYGAFKILLNTGDRIKVINQAHLKNTLMNLDDLIALAIDRAAIKFL